MATEKKKVVCICGPFMGRQVSVFGRGSRTVEVHNNYCVKKFGVSKIG